MSTKAQLEQLGKVEAELALLREMIDHNPAGPEPEARGGGTRKDPPPEDPGQPGG